MLLTRKIPENESSAGAFEGSRQRGESVSLISIINSYVFAVRPEPPGLTKLNQVSGASYIPPESADVPSLYPHKGFSGTVQEEGREGKPPSASVFMCRGSEAGCSPPSQEAACVQEKF